MKAVAGSHQHGVPLSVKAWSRDPTTVAQVLLRSKHVTCKDCPHMIQRYGNCLLNAIATVNSDCALSSWEPDLDSPAFDLSAAEFNTSMVHDSQREPDATYRLVHENTADLQFYAKKSGQWICHQRLSETDGHWCAVCFTSDWEVRILDPAAGSVMLSIQLDRLSTVLPDMVSLLTWFRLVKVQHEENLQMDGPYALRGAGPSKPSCSASSSKLMEIVAPLTSCVECQAPLAPAHIVPGRLYGLTGVQAIHMVTKRCTKKTCRAHHHYNYRKVEGEKFHGLPLEDMQYVFVNSKLGFSRDFLDYHNALQFRGGISQLRRRSSGKIHISTSAAQLYYLVLQEGSEMWASSKPADRSRLLSIKVEDPLHADFLKIYSSWWHQKQITLREWRQVKEVVIDGHEKVAAKCHNAPPAHAGRPRKNKQTKHRQNGWFMAVDPASGLVLAVTNMKDPETVPVAKQVLKQVLNRGTAVDCVIYDKMCICMKSIAKDKDFAQIKYWCVDRFHAKGHSSSCPCSPLNHSRLDRRLRDVNSSIAEQTFSWFRGYAASFNSKSPDTHIFYVLLYVKKHNTLIRKDYMQHLNAFSARAKVGKAARILRRPSCRKYVCRRPSSSSMSTKETCANCS